MTERAEVEALLAEVNVYTGRKSGLIAELCHLWLRVQDAPVGEISAVINDGFVYVETAPGTFDDESYEQRVRLVPDGDACIGGGEGK